MTKHVSPRLRGIIAVRADATNAQALIEQLMTTVAEFKAANDERFKQIEAKGAQDVVTAEKVDRINATITELKKAIDEQAKTTARLSIGGGGATDEVKAAQQFFAHARNRAPRASDQVDIQAYRGYRDAFDSLIRQGGNVDALGQDIRAALSVGSDRDGGYLVPTETSMEIEQRIHDTSPMRQIATVRTIGAPAWEAPWKSSRGTSGGWVGERQTRSATATPTVGVQRIETHEQYAYPEVTQSMLDDGALNVEQFIVQETEDEMSRTENTAFVSGDGVMRPKGFAAYKATAVTTADATRTWGLLQYIATGAAGAIPDDGSIAGASNPDCFINAITALHPNYRAGAVWAMNRQTEALVRKMKDGDGRYLVGVGSVEGALQFNLFGFPIVNLEDMEAVASDSFSIAFGNFRRGYYIIDRIGFRVLRDPYTNKPYVGFYITKRTGGDVRNFDAIKLMKFASS